MNTLDIALTAIGGLIVVTGLLSEPLKRSLLSATLLAMLVGILLGPSVLGLLDLSEWGKPEVILEQASRLTIAMGLMGIALRLPSGYVLSHWRSMVVLVGPVMLLMWLISGLLTYLILGLPFWVAMLVGAVITPTDPVIASTIVTGKVAEQNLPARLRNLMSGESGANDGLAYPLVFLAILMLERPPDEALVHWLTYVVLWEVGAAVVFGVLIGYLAGRLLHWAEASDSIGQPSYLAYTLALSVTVLGAAKLLGTDGILAVFAAGVALNMAVSTKERHEEERIQEAVNRFFILPVFVLFGLALPWGEWLELGWAGLILVGAVLLLRRLPAVVALNPLLVRTRGFDDALFLGWFGPIGVAALFYASLSLREAGKEEVWVIASLIIFASVLVHGMSAAPFTKLYGRRVQNSNPDEQ